MFRTQVSREENVPLSISVQLHCLLMHFLLFPSASFRQERSLSWRCEVHCSVFYPQQGLQESTSLLESGQAESVRAAAQALLAPPRGHGVTMLLPALSGFHMLTFPTLPSLRLFM